MLKYLSSQVQKTQEMDEEVRWDPGRNQLQVPLSATELWPGVAHI